MAVTFQADANKVAIYKSTSDAPFDNPENYIGITKFHSSWQYLPIEPARTISKSIAVPGASAFDRTIIVGPHGQPGIPFIGGYVVLNGQNVPFAGTIPIAVGVNGNIIGWTLGVTATNVIIYEIRSTSQDYGTIAAKQVKILISTKLAA